MLQGLQIYFSSCQKRNQPSWSGHYYFSSLFQSFFLLFPYNTIPSPIDGNGADPKEIGKALDLLVDLNSQLPGRRQDQGVQLRGACFGYFIKNGKYKCGGFARPCLGGGDQVLSFLDQRNSLRSEEHTSELQSRPHLV